MRRTTVPALLLVAHGSRDPRFVATAGQVRHAVAAQLPGVAVELSYLDLNEPLVGDALAALAARTDEVIVVPLLLGDGYHSRFDLPAILSGVARRRTSLRATQTPIVGDTTLVPALAARLRQAGVTSSDGVLMCAVGSSDAGSDAAATRRAAELSAHLRLPVEIVFATKLGEHNAELRRAVDTLHTYETRRIVLSPYFLSEGLLTERVSAALRTLTGDAISAAPIADHRCLVNAVTDRYRCAATPTTDRVPPLLAGSSGPWLVECN